MINDVLRETRASHETTMNTNVQKKYLGADPEDENATIVPIRLPYDIPLLPHSPGECYTREYAHQAIRDFT